MSKVDFDKEKNLNFIDNAISKTGFEKGKSFMVSIIIVLKKESNNIEIIINNETGIK